MYPRKSSMQILVHSAILTSVFILPICAGLRSRERKETQGSDEENTLIRAGGRKVR